LTLSALPRWTTIVFVGLLIVFVGEAVYLFGARFFDWVESDAAVTTLMAADVLRTGHVVPTDWYYGNGDVWLFCTHLIALLPVAVLGIGPEGAIATLVLGLALEVAALGWAYHRLSGRRDVSIFAALATLGAWSQFHVAFAYLQLAYGFHATTHLVVFTCLAAVLGSPGGRRPLGRRIDRRLAIALGLLFLVAAANPLRGMIFLLAPFLVGCAWPWRGLERRLRLVAGGAAVVTWTAGLAVYRLVFLRICTFTPWPSHEVFAFRDAKGIAQNLEMLGQGVLTLSGARFFVAAGPPEGVSAPVVLGLAVLAGAVLLVGLHAFRSRELTPLRFVAVVVFAQLGGTLAPLVVGNLMEAAHSIRYVMTSILLLYGLAAVVAVDALDDPRMTRPAAAWLIGVPVAALVVGLRAVGLPPVPGRASWPDVGEHRRLVGELAARQLTHGFTDNWNANVLTLLARGRIRACPVFFSHVLVPQRWNVERSCYDRRALDDRWFVVSYKDSAEDLTSLRNTARAEPLEQFSVGSSYLVSIFRGSDARNGWLDLPLDEGERMRFPFRLDATHVLFRRALGIEEGGAVVSNGEPGVVLYGPYVKVPRGDYRVLWTGSGRGGDGEIVFDVAPNAKVATESRVRASDLAPGAHAELAKLAFSLPDTSVVEFRVRSDLGGRVAVESIVLERL
jgi:hypothetical protein